MKSKRLIIPEDKIINIKDFMESYLKVEYNEEGRLTHYEMDQYLLEKGKQLPTRVSFKNVKILDINNGRYVAVREETKRKKKGRLLIYENPFRFDSMAIIRELNSKNENKKNYELMQARKKTLEKYHDLTLDEMGEVIAIKELQRIREEELYQVTESVNRQHVYQLSNGKHLRRRERY